MQSYYDMTHNTTSSIFNENFFENTINHKSSHKILVFSANSCWSMWRFRGDLLKHLKQQGHTIHIIAPEDAYTKSLQAMGLHVHTLHLSAKGLNPIEDLKTCWQFYQLYKKIQPNCIFQYTIKPNIWGSFAARMADMADKTIAINTGLGSALISTGKLNELVQKLYKTALKNIQQVWFLNETDLDFFLEKQLINPKQAKILPGEGIDCQLFSPNQNFAFQESLESFQPNQTNHNDNFTFLLIARLLKDKGIYEYVEAAKQIKQTMPNVVFKLIGPADVDNPTAISALEAKSWQHIEYLGEQHDIKAHINDADCIVLPSYREGLSRTLLEAASMAKPLIASNVAGCKDLIDDGENGFLCQPKDVQSLCESMQKILQQNKMQLNTMGEYGRKKVLAQFSIEKIIAAYEEVIEKLRD